VWIRLVRTFPAWSQPALPPCVDTFRKPRSESAPDDLAADVIQYGCHGSPASRCSNRIGTEPARCALALAAGAQANGNHIRARERNAFFRSTSKGRHHSWINKGIARFSRSHRAAKPSDSKRLLGSENRKASKRCDVRELSRWIGRPSGSATFVDFALQARQADLSSVFPLRSLRPQVPQTSRFRLRLWPRQRAVTARAGRSESGVRPRGEESGTSAA
jgi:hypothetical protein